MGAWVPLVGLAACSAGNTTTSSTSGDPNPGKSTASALTIPFPGAGNAGQSQLLLAGFTPNACAVAGPSANFDGGAMQVAGPDHVTCYYSSVVPGTPMAFLEQVVETAQGQGLIHVRLTMNPAFVDNTYGTTAIGWSSGDAGTAAPAAPAPPTGMGMMGAMGMPGGTGMGTPMPAGPGGHTFNDLVGSDHAEFDLSDASGATALSFDLDYVSSDSSALSGYATLGVNGGDGKMLTGAASAIAYASTSLDRDLNACGYESYTTNSPATDSSYTPNAATPNWDYRVVYDVWVEASAFPGGFGAATIPYVHASPAKLSATLPVTPGPCPPPFDSCDGGACDADAGACVGENCPDPGFCAGEGCDDASFVISR
ncbi:MAG TPA: hypothetical protein VH044_09620 [Polyangiaceae bacterium]|nr:hypothetical protein [Polyangiaceae bacterium]